MESKPHSFRWTFLKFVSSKKSKSFTMIYCISIKKWNTKKMHLSLWNSQTFYVFGYPVSLTFAWLNFSIFPYILSFLNWNAYLINANFIPMLTWFRNCLNCFDQNLLHFCWAIFSCISLGCISYLMTFHLCSTAVWDIEEKNNYWITIFSSYRLENPELTSLHPSSSLPSSPSSSFTYYHCYNHRHRLRKL